MENDDLIDDVRRFLGGRPRISDAPALRLGPGYTERWCYRCGQVALLAAYREEGYLCKNCGGKTESRINRYRVIRPEEQNQ